MKLLSDRQLSYLRPGTELRIGHLGNVYAILEETNSSRKIGEILKEELVNCDYAILQERVKDDISLRNKIFALGDFGVNTAVRINSEGSISILTFQNIKDGITFELSVVLKKEYKIQKKEA